MRRTFIATSWRGLAPLSAAVIAASCSGPTVPDDYLVVGAISGYNSGDPAFVVPDTVVAGKPFSATVHTYGNSCRRIGPTEVTADSLGLVITPYDYADTTAEICLDYLNVMVHEVSLVIPQAGRASVRVRGMNISDQLVEFSQPVWVRPPSM